MRLTSWGGLLILLSGVILIAYNLTAYIPDPNTGILGLLAVLLGPLIFVAGIIQGRFIGPFMQRPASTLAWIFLGAGLLTAFDTFLIQGQAIGCSISPCFGLPGPIYDNTVFRTGIFFAAVSIIFLASQLRRGKPQELRPA